MSADAGRPASLGDIIEGAIIDILGTDGVVRVRAVKVTPDPDGNSITISVESVPVA